LIKKRDSWKKQKKRKKFGKKKNLKVKDLKNKQNKMSATKKWTRRMNTISRNFDEFGNSLSAVKSRVSSAIKSASKKIGYGEEKSLDKVRKAQKQKFRYIYQQVQKEEAEDVRRAINEKRLKESISILQSGVAPPSPPLDSSSLSSSPPSSSPPPLSLGGAAAVNKALYIKRVNEYVTSSLIEYEKSKDKNGKPRGNSKTKFPLVQSQPANQPARPIHLLSTSFFTDTMFDESETISWSSFKENVFYNYLKQMSENASKLRTEIKALGIIKRAFKELLSESSSSNDKGEVSYGNLFKRLQLFKSFDVTDDFWKLPCWGKDYEDQVVNEDDFINRWISPKSIQDLQTTLKEFEQEQRSNLPIKSLILTGSDVDNFEESKEPSHDFDDEKINQTGKSAKVSVEKKSTSTASKRKFFKSIRTIDGVPKELESIYYKFGKLSRIILRKLVIVAKKVSDNKLASNKLANKSLIGDSKLAVAKELFLSYTILYDNAIKDLETLVQQADAEYNLQVKNIKKKATDLLTKFNQEYEEKKNLLLLTLDSLKSEKLILHSVLRRNFRREFRALKISPSLLSTDYSTVNSKVFNNQKQEIGKIAASALTSSVDLLPSSVDYTNELHEPFTQSLGDFGHLFASVLIKEWQQFNATGSLERLSIEFFKSLVSDYGNLDNVIDTLDVLKLHGVSTVNEFDEFYARKDRDTGKARAKILTQALYNSIDEFYELKTIDEIRASLYSFGPLMVTLPVKNKFSASFWQGVTPPSPPSSSSKGVGGAAPSWHTVAVIGYDDERKVFLLRNSRGKQYGKFGNSEISYDDILTNSQVIAVTDKDRRQKTVEEDNDDEDFLTTVIKSGISLVEYGNDKRKIVS
jgi:hypothetical protein